MRSNARTNPNDIPVSFVETLEVDMLLPGEPDTCHPEFGHPTSERAGILSEPMEWGDAIGSHRRQHSRKEDRNGDARCIKRRHRRAEKYEACEYRERYEKHVHRDAVRL